MVFMKDAVTLDVVSDIGPALTCNNANLKTIMVTFIVSKMYYDLIL